MKDKLRNIKYRVVALWWLLTRKHYYLLSYTDRRGKTLESYDVVIPEFLDWFKDNLWHDASEEPEKNKLCLVKIDIIDGFKIASDYTTSSFSDNGWTENYFPDDYDVNVSRWLYIEDLMKAGK